MVTAKKYLEAYFNVIRERNVLLMKKIGQKSRMDARMLKRTPTDARAAEMIAWIGTSEEPIKGKMNEQPIRRLLWQINKSADFFAAKRKEVEAKAAAEKAKAQTAAETPAEKAKVEKLIRDIDHYMQTVSNLVPQFLRYTIKLSEIYKKEATALSAKDYATYNNLVTQEKTIAAEFHEARQIAIAKIQDETGLIINGMANLGETTSIAALEFNIMSILISASAVAGFVADLPTATALFAGIATIGAASSVGLIRWFKSAAAV